LKLDCTKKVVQYSKNQRKKGKREEKGSAICLLFFLERILMGNEKELLCTVFQDCGKRLAERTECFREL